LLYRTGSRPRFFFFPRCGGFAPPSAFVFTRQAPEEGEDGFCPRGPFPGRLSLYPQPRFPVLPFFLLGRGRGPFSPSGSGSRPDPFFLRNLPANHFFPSPTTKCDPLFLLYHPSPLCCKRRQAWPFFFFSLLRNFFPPGSVASPCSSPFLQNSFEVWDRVNNDLRSSFSSARSNRRSFKALVPLFFEEGHTDSGTPFSLPFPQSLSSFFPLHWRSSTAFFPEKTLPNLIFFFLPLSARGGGFGLRFPLSCKLTNPPPLANTVYSPPFFSTFPQSRNGSLFFSLF